MGASIENNHIQAACYEKAKLSGKVEIIKQKVASIKPARNDYEKPVVTLENGETIEPKLLVGSDGMNSKTREEYGISTWGYSYNTSGVVCTLSTV